MATKPEVMTLEEQLDHFGETAMRIKVERDALALALKPFADAYRKKYDPGISDLDNEQPVAWHVPLGAYRTALLLTSHLIAEHGDFTGLDAALDELRKPVDEVRE